MQHDSQAQVNLDSCHRRGAMLVIAACIAVQLVVVAWFVAHMNPAIARLMPDDAMYYLQIARHIVHGEGSAFSPGELTNGYHPLWMAALVTLQWVLRTSNTQFIGAVLVLAVTCNGGAAWTLYQLLIELRCGPRRALLGVLLHLISPWFLCLTLTGLETPLYLWCLYSFFRRFRAVTQVEPVHRRSWIAFGAACGLLMLARTDSIFFVLPALTYLALRRAGGPRLVEAALVAGLIVSPWLLWNYLTFGSIVQSSGTAISALLHFYLRHDTPLQWCTFWCYTYVVLMSNVFISLFLQPYEYHAVSWGMAIIIFLVTGGLALQGVRGAARQPPPVPLPRAVWVLPPVLLVVFYVCVRCFAQVWHMAPLLVMLLLVMVFAVRDRWLDRSRILALAVALLALDGAALRSCYYYPQEAHDYVPRALAYHADSLQRLKVGHTDCGYLGYFSRHEIVNLDGVVNNNVERAICDGRFSDYIESRHFDRVVLEEKSRLSYYDRNRRGSCALVLAIRDDDGAPSTVFHPRPMPLPTTRLAPVPHAGAISLWKGER